MARIPTIATLGFLTFSAPLAAQEAAFLAEVPTAQQVAGGLAVASPRETAARRYAALFALENLVGSLAGTSAPPQVQERMTAFSRMRNQVYEAEKQRDPVNYLLERCSQAYSESPGFQRELLDLYFTPGWQATYGPRLDPRRWKAPLAMAPGAKVTAASLSPPMVEECGSVPAGAAPRTAVAAAPSDDPVERQRAEARAILQGGDTVRALEAYKRIVSAYPSRYEGYVGLGLIYVAQHQYALALPAWQKVAELAPTDGFSRYMVGASYANLRRYEEARDVLVAVTRMKTSPETLGWAHYMLGVSYARLGQREKAAESYGALAVLDTALASKLAVELNAPKAAQGTTPGAAKPSEPAGPLATSGLSYLSAGDTTRALEAFKAAVAAQPPALMGYVGLGRIYTARREYSLSVSAWQQAAALAPTDWSVLFSLAVAHHGAKQYPEARDMYLKAVRARPPQEFAGQMYEGLGAVYLQLGQRDSAVAVYRALVPIDSARANALAARISKTDEAAKGAPPPAAPSKPPAPGADVEALRAEGKKYFKAKEYLKAQQAYEQALKLNPLDGWSLYGYGEALMMNNVENDKPAGAAWKRVLTIDSKDAELLVAVGEALHVWLFDPAAIDAYEQAIALEPGAKMQANAEAGMGWYHSSVMMNKYAEVEFKEAIRLDPGNTEYVYALGLNYVRWGKKDDAMVVFQQLTKTDRKKAQELLAEMNKK